MTPMHQHRCSLCGTVWKHGHDSFECFPEHICRTCGFLELMVFMPDNAPMGPGDYPQAVANFLKVLDNPDESVRTAAAFSLGRLAAERYHVVPALVRKASEDSQPTVRKAAVEALGRFGVVLVSQSSGE